MTKPDPGEQQLSVQPLLAHTATRRSAIRRAALAALTLVGLSTATATGCDPETFSSD